MTSWRKPLRGSTSTVIAGGVRQGDVIVLAKASATVSSPPDVSVEVEVDVEVDGEVEVPGSG